MLVLMGGREDHFCRVHCPSLLTNYYSQLLTLDEKDPKPTLRRQCPHPPSCTSRCDSQKHIDLALTSPFGGGRGWERPKRVADEPMAMFLGGAEMVKWTVCVWCISEAFLCLYHQGYRDSVLWSTWNYTRELLSGKSELNSLLNYLACKNNDIDSVNSGCEGVASVKSNSSSSSSPSSSSFLSPPLDFFLLTRLGRPCSRAPFDQGFYIAELWENRVFWPHELLHDGVLPKVCFLFDLFIDLLVIILP